MEPPKIIAKYRDGRMLKGTTRNFWPENDSFHVIPLGVDPAAPPVEVKVRELKAVFVVRTLKGNPDRVKQKRCGPPKPLDGQRMAVTFKDGEVLEGTTLEYTAEGQGFFLTPGDRNGNNKRIFIVNEAVEKIRRF